MFNKLHSASMEAKGAWAGVANFSQEAEERSSRVKDGPSGRGQASQERTRFAFKTQPPELLK